MANPGSVISQIGALSSEPLPTILAALESAKEILRRAGCGSEGAVILLDLSMNFQHPIHTQAIVYILNIASAVNPNIEIFTAMRTALLNGDATQLSESPLDTTVLASNLRDIAVTTDQPRLAIAPLQAGISKLIANRPLITPLHAMLFQCCLLANIPIAAVPALEQDAYDVDPHLTGMVVRDFLLYCYYGALIHIARKRYSEAADLLLSAMTSPAAALSAIVMAAWKKWVLLGLLTRGSIQPLPKWASQPLLRANRSEGPYQEVAIAYSGTSAATMNEVVRKNLLVFEEDENVGLVNLVVEAQTKRNVLRLTQTFITLSLSDVAKQVGLPSAESAELAILRMIDAGEVVAEIDGGKGMVRFLEDPQQFNSPATIARMDSQIAAAAALGERLAATRHEVSRSSSYLAKMHRKSDILHTACEPDSLLGDEDDANMMMPVEPSLSGHSAMQS